MNTQDKLAEALRDLAHRWKNLPKGEFQLAGQLCGDELERLLDNHAAEASQTPCGADPAMTVGGCESVDRNKASQAQPQAAESHKGLLIGTTPSGLPYSLHGTKESVTAVSDMLEQADRYIRQAELRSCEPKCDSSMAKESGNE